MFLRNVSIEFLEIFNFKYVQQIVSDQKSTNHPKTNKKAANGVQIKMTNGSFRVSSTNSSSSTILDFDEILYN